MKRLLLLFLFSSILNLNAQNYTPFPDSNAVWVNGDYWVDWSGEVPEYVLSSVTSYCMTNQDTTIGGNLYSKLFICNGSYFGALRDTAAEIYFVPKDSLSEFLVYDFTVTIGQVIPDVYAGNIGDYTVSNIDSILIGGEYRTRIYLGGNGGFWLEGIGCSRGLFNDPFEDLDATQDLLCMSYIDSNFYPTYGFGYCPMDLGFTEHVQNINQILSFPNPTTGTFIIETERNASFESIVVTTCMGQKMETEINIYENQIQIDLSNVPSGIYFVILTNSSEKFIGKIIKE